MKTVYAGNCEKTDRSDCSIALTLKESGGIQISLNSKVAVLYGALIRQSCESVLTFFGIDHAELQIDDSGAADYVITARLEACIKQLKKTDRSRLPELLPQNTAGTARDRLRRSRLYLPGNTPKLAINAGLHSGDGIILDLEDSVAPARKDEARILVRNTLRAVNFYGAERMVRINQGERGLMDLDAVVPQHVNVILLPKCESAEQVRVVDSHIQQLRKEHHIEHETWIMPIIESAVGVLRAFEIAGASPNVIALAVGLEDYTADIGAPRTPGGTESFFARSMIVNAAKACGIQAIDSVFSDISDMEALRENVLASKALGFDGMGCIHPRQIRVIHEAFAPTAEELEKAQKIVEAFHMAEEKGLGVVAVGSKMIDPPVVKRALRIVELAKNTAKV
ncbi:MAG: aldolase/citrate lyase family protein [Candidatus Marinimicrobia bacterium]|nr:aldolase/citrate lyase family protein [Candidatus Neomarinimicrobiota bacterium]MDD4960799.1 aldolase/citrate lyase family protein [Candidatus Neomarinimicrobiota bacterium]MDD5710000.1 aldolase/citrate lyase family protein [Candidatus Neomarinimicrobiota bacterium]MDX9777160.1 aldolase/citrate lyase family protein [bacterium]